MRILFLFAVTFCITAVKAQTFLPGSFADYSYRGFAHNIPVGDSAGKWSFSRYASLSAGYSFFKGGSAMVVAAPMWLQLNRRLNNNLYAFAGVSVAPAYTSFNHNFVTGEFTKPNGANSFLKTNALGIYSKAELGLMYINDAKTFSISGSIGVERSSYPVYYNGTNNGTPYRGVGNK